MENPVNGIKEITTTAQRNARGVTSHRENWVPGGLLRKEWMAHGKEVPCGK